MKAGLSEPQTLPRTVPKPWGSELWFAHTDKYAGKLLNVSAGHRLSLQYHVRKDESAYLLSGRLLLITGDDETSLREVELEPGGRRVPHAQRGPAEVELRERALDRVL